jgi:membrane-associated phospholipid phosphatase
MKEKSGKNKKIEELQEPKTAYGINHSILAYCALLAFVVFIYQYLVGWQFSIYFLGLFLLPVGFFMFGYVFTQLNNNLSILALIWRSLGYFTLITPLLFMACVFLPLTPHAIADPLLKSFDAAIGINVAVLMSHFKTNQPVLTDFFWWTYQSITWQVVLVVLIMPLLSMQKVEQFYQLACVTFVVTLVICYFFPSINPYYSYPDYHFYSGHIIEAHAYVAFRADRLVSVNDNISCPSYHVITALMLIHVFWSLKRFHLRYVFLILNILMICSTVITGWHYVIDVIAGFAVFYFSLGVIYLLDFIYQRLSLYRLKFNTNKAKGECHA